MSDQQKFRPKPGARDRILDAAYELFSRRGVREVSVDEIIRRSGVAIATFYRHFSSKNELVEAFLTRREQLWTSESIIESAKQLGSTPRERLLAIFDVFADWFERDDFEGDSFVNVLIEMGPQHPLGQTAITHLSHVRAGVEQMAREAGLKDAADFASSFQLLMKGAIITSTMGDIEAAYRAKRFAAWLIEQHTPDPAESSGSE
ncbi:TetR/AcrR family transcriptional regulator [Ruicaihuangia caeni]|uniref:TetR/AcrR family transcriptional regulator n=1 Tax=Ruicaihuangia caeni TaxID=3042517 RepID=A0AAW6T4Y3_9MICO|nr:TetR/AcrR family transcriptional regulator [Klugiella sp. YN-L-19]MDI2098504.1 TetR/AcrR family transcriptional regulator [Klugiella sp. YN-L-19]